MANKTRHLRQHLVPELGGERLDKLTEFRLKQYRKKRSETGASPATVNREMATLSHLLNSASSKAWGWISKEDVPEIPKEKEQRKKIPHPVRRPAQATCWTQPSPTRTRGPWLFVHVRLERRDASQRDRRPALRRMRLRSQPHLDRQGEGWRTRAADHRRASRRPEAATRDGGRSGRLDISPRFGSTRS